MQDINADPLGRRGSPSEASSVRERTWLPGSVGQVCDARKATRMHADKRRTFDGVTGDRDRLKTSFC